MQRFGFGSAVHLDGNPRYLVPHGVYWRVADGAPASVEVVAPTDDELKALLQMVIARLMQIPRRRGTLVEDLSLSDLAEPDADRDEACSLRPLQASAVTDRFACGTRAGQRMLTPLGAMPA